MLESNKQIINQEKDRDSIGKECVSFSKLYENIFFTGSNNGGLKICIVEESGYVTRKKYQVHENKITSMVSSLLNENLLCTVGLDRKLKLFDLKIGKVVQETNLGFGGLCCALNEADYTMVVGGHSGMMMKYDLRNLGTELIKFEGHSNQPIVALDFNPRLLFFCNL